MNPKSSSFFKRLIVPRSLRYQLLTRSLLIMAVLLLFIGSLQFWLMKDFLYSNKAKTMQSQITALPREFLNPNMHGPGHNLHEDSKSNPNRIIRPLLILPDSSLAIIDSSGGFIDISGENGNTSPQLNREQYSEIMREWTEHKHIDYQVVQPDDGAEQLAVFEVLGPLHNPIGLLQMSTETAPLQAVLIRQLMTFIGLAFIALISGLAVSLPVIRRTLDPLSQMVDTVERTNVGNLSDRLSIHHGQEEIDRLSNSFNHMLERLDASFHSEREAKEQMRRFIADASHELRTPLTSIHGFLEVLLRGAANNQEQLTKALNSMHGESKRINKLVEDLLLLAKLDRAPQLHCSDTDIAEIVREMEPQLRVLGGARNIQIETAEKIKGSFDTDKLRQVILNLFENAVQHTDPIQGRIELKLAIINNKAGLSVQDNGTGIAQEHILHVFERFYRNESSRNRRSGGAGLGLSITKSIVEAHRGTIRVESQSGEGCLFIVRLPLSV